MALYIYAFCYVHPGILFIHQLCAMVTRVETVAPAFRMDQDSSAHVPTAGLDIYVKQVSNFKFDIKGDSISLVHISFSMTPCLE